MAAQLKLVVDNAVIPCARPYTTHYYHSVRDKPTEWSRIGRAASPLGGVHAACKHILVGKWAKAIVHGTAGEIMFRLERRGQRIEIFGLFSALDQ